MCKVYDQENMGGYENADISTWSKGIGFVFCYSIFLLHLINKEGLLIIDHNLSNTDNYMVYYLSIGNIIGASVLLVFSILGHFVSKIFMRPIHIICFLASLFFFSSGLYTTTICKNTSLRIIGVMDALKYHPKYMILQNVDAIKITVSLNEPMKEINILESEEITKNKEKKPNDELTSETHAANPPISNDKETPKKNENPEIQADYKLNSNDSLNKICFDTNNGNTQNFIFTLFNKIKIMKENNEIYKKMKDNLNKNVELKSVVDNLEHLTEKITNALQNSTDLLFRAKKFELIKYEGKDYKIYEDSIQKIKEVNEVNKIPTLNDYIKDDLEQRNILILCSVFIFMAFIYIQKGITLTKKHSMFTSLLYGPCMSYILIVACVFFCSGIISLSILATTMYSFGMVLVFLLIFSQCFCENLFKFLMATVFSCLLVFSSIIEYVIIQDFNNGTNMFKKHTSYSFGDISWVLLNSQEYEIFKKYILFSKGRILLICIALNILNIVYCLYSTFYNFRSLFPERKRIVSFA